MRRYYGVLFFVACMVFGVLSADRGLAVSYSNSDNAVEKRTILRSVGNTTSKRGAGVDQWVKDLLKNGIQDSKATVVASAIDQVGKLQISDFNSDLISLYKVCDSKFENVYSNRVKTSIVKTLGKNSIANKDVINLFCDILNPAVSGFLYVQNDVLLQIKIQNSSIYDNSVKKYKSFLQNGIAQKKGSGEDPISYQVLEDYVNLCDDILSHKDGK